MKQDKDPAAAKRDGRKENAAVTQAALRAAGRRLFGSLGYEATSLGALCAEAGVTTGALYHHFGDKKGLFAAVAEELDMGLVALVGEAGARALGQGKDHWSAFLAGVDTLLAAGVDAGGRRIGLVDASAVLGADGWLAIRERHGLGAMVGTVRALQAGGLLQAGEPVRLARIILGMLYGAIEALPEDPARVAEALAETRQLVHTMLAGLRPR
ncbi:MAG: TetR/AcrR family transcriptional regulator [Pseudomonadota bacterium]